MDKQYSQSGRDTNDPRHGLFARKTSGTIVFKGTRVPPAALWDTLAAGFSLNDFLDDFPTVSRDQAIQAIKAAKDLVLRDIPVSSLDVGPTDGEDLI